MSVQEATVNGQDVSAEDSHDGDPPIETGGSQLADDVSAVGDDGERTEEAVEETATETTAEAEKPEPKEEKASTASVSAEEVAEMRAEIEAARRMRDDVLAIAKANPAVAKAFGIGGQDDGTGSRDYRSKIDTAIDEAFAPADGKALKGALAPLFEELAELRRQVGRADSTAGKVAQTQAQRDFRQGLVEAKVPVDNPAFVKLQKELRRDPEFAEAEARGAKWAIRATSDAWFASAGRKAVNGDERARIQAAKGGRIGGRPAANAATAEKVIRMAGEYDPMKAYQIREAAVRAGKPMPRFEWIEENKK